MGATPPMCLRLLEWSLWVLRWYQYHVRRTYHTLSTWLIWQFWTSVGLLRSFRLREITLKKQAFLWLIWLWQMMQPFTDEPLHLVVILGERRLKVWQSFIWWLLYKYHSTWVAVLNLPPVPWYWYHVHRTYHTSSTWYQVLWQWRVMWPFTDDWDLGSGGLGLIIKCKHFCICLHEAVRTLPVA